jgi:hypothetical protein
LKADEDRVGGEMLYPGTVSILPFFRERRSSTRASIQRALAEWRSERSLCAGGIFRTGEIDVVSPIERCVKRVIAASSAGRAAFAK